MCVCGCVGGCNVYPKKIMKSASKIEKNANNAPKNKVEDVEPHANFKAIWAPYLRYLERPNTGQNQIYPGSAIGGLYFTSDIHRPCLRSSPKVTLDMEIDAAGVKILLVELSTLLI